MNSVFIEPVKEYGSKEISPIVLAIQGLVQSKHLCGILRKSVTPIHFTADLHFCMSSQQLGGGKATITILLFKRTIKQA